MYHNGKACADCGVEEGLLHLPDCKIGCGKSAKGPDNTGRKQDGTFAPGVSGNPAGRPKSARSKLSESFIQALLADFEKASEQDGSLGELAIAAMRADKPNEYARMIASILAKELDANVSGDMSEDLKRWLGIG